MIGLEALSEAKINLAFWTVVMSFCVLFMGAQFHVFVLYKENVCQSGVMH